MPLDQPQYTSELATMSVEEAMQQAVAHHKAGQLQQAEQFYRTVLQAEPGRPDANYHLGLLAFHVGRQDEALEFLRTALQASPDQGHYWMTYSEALLAVGMVGDAEFVLKQGMQKGLSGPSVEELMSRITQSSETLPSPTDAEFSADSCPEPPEADAQPAAAASNTSPTEELFAQGARLFQGGHLAEAERIYRQILAKEPQHADSLNMLGIIAYQKADAALALKLIGEAIAINDATAEFHSNLGIVLMHQGRLEEAIASYRLALGRKPDYPEALYNLGNALLGQGRSTEAIASYRLALELKPDFPEALSNLGNAFQDLGRLDDAVACFRRLLTIRPELPEALANLGNALQIQGKLDEAIEHYHRALALRWEYPEALLNLAIALLAQEKTELAMTAVLNALQLQETTEGRVLFCNCLKIFDLGSEGAELEDIYEFAIRALEEAWVRPKELALPCLALITYNQALQGLAAQALSVWPERLPEPVDPVMWETIAEDYLLTTLLKSTTVPKIEFERFLTCVRHAMLNYATGTPLAETDAVLDSFCAVAQQCFINEYLFACTPEEAERAQQLRDQLAAALESGAPIRAIPLAAVAAYFPLHTLPGAHTLRQGSWPDALKEMLRQQVEEPGEEAGLRAAIPRLTQIDDPVSELVQQMYEQNPYPRWVKAPDSPAEASLDTCLHREFPLAPFGDLNKTGQMEILVAGCGTGQHSIETARRFPGARVLAVDLSLSSLSYAQRKTTELGIGNVEYAQADIMRLGELDRRFDLIESVGTLVCLQEPMAGWKILLSLLNPGGFMRIGLYSESARRCVIAARNHIAGKGYQGSSARDIRQCRQDVAALALAGDAQMAQLLSLGDFYSMSECRDLIFHVQEHRHTIPRIKENLEELGLHFIGFSLEPGVVAGFRARFPEDPSRTDLDCWDAFERENPGTFTGLYQFWVQKPA
jgi:tetratricopeptide (TPR) repeat protein/SAM-dependent methyltransferase